MQASMWSLSPLPAQKEYPQLPISSPSSSTCAKLTSLHQAHHNITRLGPSRCRLLECSPICVCNAPERGHVEKAAIVGGVFRVSHGNAVKSRHKAVFAMGVLHDGEQGNMPGAARTTDVSSEGYNVTEARRGLAIALCKGGLSEKDSNLIAFKAPITVQLLINAALELDEYATWIDQQPPKHRDLKQKVIELAMASPSRQFAALFESIGVQKAHISRVCHFLASQNIADVLQKIRLLEDVFPDVKDDGIVIRSRRMMREMSLSADGGLQKTLSFFEKFLDRSKAWRDRHIEHSKGGHAASH